MTLTHAVNQYLVNTESSNFITHGPFGESRTTKELRASIDKLLETKKSLLGENNQLKGEVENLERLNRELEGKNQQLKGQVEHLEGEVVKLTETLSILRLQLMNSHHNLDYYREKLDAAEEEVKYYKRHENPSETHPEDLENPSKTHPENYTEGNPPLST